MAHLCRHGGLTARARPGKKVERELDKLERGAQFEAVLAKELARRGMSPNSSMTPTSGASPSNQLSNARRRQRRTTADIHGRTVPGQVCCGAGSLRRYFASGRRGQRQRGVDGENLTQMLAAARSGVGAIDGEGHGQGASNWL